MTNLRERWRKCLFVQISACLAFSAIIAWSFVQSEFDFGTLFNSGPRFQEFFTRLVPPNWGVTTLVVNSTVETLMITLAGTFLAVVIAFPLGFLAADNVTPGWISHPTKLLLGFMRSIPLIVVAMIFVVAVGLGPFPGALAIAFHSIGMLGKFYAEEFETAEPGILNAVSGTGATWIQTIRFGLLPQSIPQVLAFTIYRFELNFRDATVLGLVGAGGIGYYIQLYVRGFQYDKVAILILVIIIVVTLLDQLSFRVRKWVQ